jgi:hypothetical protein
VLERHKFADANNRSLWLTYDFAGQSGLQNISEHPLDFEFDGVFVAYNLPNGLMAYMLATAEGNRLSEGPLQIVQDESQTDYLVRGAVSCMGCHVDGVVRAQDDVRAGLDSGQLYEGLDAADKDALRDLYPGQAAIDALLDQDTLRFMDALQQSGVPPGADPVLPAFLGFAADVDLTRAAAELGLDPEDLRQNLSKLGGDLNDLYTDGGTVQRDVFTANFAASACLLKLGRTRCCPDDMDENLCF